MIGCKVYQLFGYNIILQKQKIGKATPLIPNNGPKGPSSAKLKTKEEYIKMALLKYGIPQTNQELIDHFYSKFFW